MISEGLEEVFKGDSADMFARKCSLVLMGGRACADGERGPPSARAEYVNNLFKDFNGKIFQPSVFLLRINIKSRAITLTHKDGWIDQIHCDKSIT
jgi:hypothetical protein